MPGEPEGRVPGWWASTPRGQTEKPAESSETSMDVGDAPNTAETSGESDLQGGTTSDGLTGAGDSPTVEPFRPGGEVTSFGSSSGIQPIPSSPSPGTVGDERSVERTSPADDKPASANEQDQVGVSLHEPLDGSSSHQATPTDASGESPAAGLTSEVVSPSSTPVAPRTAAEAPFSPRTVSGPTPTEYDVPTEQDTPLETNSPADANAPIAAAPEVSTPESSSASPVATESETPPPVGTPPPAPQPVPAPPEIAEEPAHTFPELKRRPLPRTIAIANQKGGVGKTTTSVNLGAALAEQDHRVLVVDLDPQGNATTGLGINSRALENSIYDVLLNDVPIEDCVESTAVLNLFVAPASLDLAGAEIELVPAFSREMRLRSALNEVKDDYDYVLIDCPPSLGLLTVNALAAADEVLVPIQCEYYALEGLGQLIRNINLVQKNLNPALELSAIVLVMYDGRTNLASQVSGEVREHFGPVVCRNVIPRNIRLSEAPSYGQPITTFDSSSKGAVAYRELAREVHNVSS